ncbi:MAG: recombinase family protein [Erysipelotrichales bacterium]|nr:recombinase family protein [Erysipelotrichales bacterium]
MLNQYTTYRAGIYCRLSSDDGTQGDSSSIQTQKAILENYCKAQGFSIYDVYTDDGFSGLNFNRPSFQRMLTDIEDKKINLVITKDLSRLGRDYIQTGHYTEIYFQSKGVRYIAVNDGIDSDNSNNDIAPFKNILNDMYSKDLSKKVKSAKRQRSLQGMYLSSQAPYGYKPNPENKNQLAIDEEAAETVKEIFDLLLSGKGTVAICKILTERKVLTPAAYKAKNGDTRFERYYALRGEDWKYNWCQATVLSITKNMVYVGDMQNHKYEIPNYKTKKRVRVPEERHIIVKNTHEPIISRSDFERAQEVRSSRKRTTKAVYEDLFKSLVFCKECGRRMHIYYKQRPKSVTILYLCSHHIKRPQECTHHNYIWYFPLKEILTAKIKALFKSLKKSDGLAKILKNSLKEDNTATKYKLEKAKIEKQLDSLDETTLRIYKDNVSGVIDHTSYSRLIQKCQTEQKSLTERLQFVEKQLEKSKEIEQNLNNFKEVINEFLDFEELTQEMVNRLISKIIVEYPIKENGEKTQEVKIVYRFIEMAL